MPLRPPAGFISAFYDPLKTPNRPIIGAATTSSTTSLTIAFTPSSNVGGSAVSGYLATAKRTSDGATFNTLGTSSPITITGLTAVPFTVTVVAINSYGPSASSSVSNSITPALPPIGDAFGGGFYAGQISVTGNSVATYNLIIGPLSTAQSSLALKNVNSDTPGADSDVNGLQNTLDMVTSGNSTVYPAAHFCNNLVTGGFDDWYMPAKNELEICFFNLKPITSNNNLESGVNPNAVPARNSPYLGSYYPGQTSAVAFKTGGAQAFFQGDYWTSTERSTGSGWIQYFVTGAQTGRAKYTPYRVRAVRKVPV